MGAMNISSTNFNQPRGAPAARLPLPLPPPSPSPRQWRRPPRRPPVAGAGGSGGGGGFGKKQKEARDKLQDTVKQQRAAQLSATDLLARLLQAPDAAAVAEEHVESLDESFFHMASTYLAMAEKEGNAEVTGRLRQAFAAAFDAKQATLRPEIQLLNKLLGCDTAEARAAVLASPEAGERLAMNDGYFFGLLRRMTDDVGGQRDGPQKAALLAKLCAVRAEAQARVPQQPWARDLD